ncbi:Cytochrome c [Aliiruegeria lutimaris]|uniref:Cytochrome c n=1 Tax=Aliiruegeria lutimaris TaxID=571298 RepID=A0A1G8SGU3_9RHOB|nr:Cytochrome c [Aliiruegeria lutimaris]
MRAWMEAAGKADSYSGEFGFVDTEMYWPITHMVAPAKQAMECEECHARNGRLANIAGVFMPGTEDDRLVGLLGKLMVLAVIADFHVLAAYAIGAFVITHVYLLTLGHGFRAHVRPMIDGYEDTDLTPEQEAYLESNEPKRLKKGGCIHQGVQAAE